MCVMPRNKWTRREFIEAGSATPALVTLIQPAAAAFFMAAERETLTAAMDGIIPAADGMPAASQAVCMDYLESTVPQIQGLADVFRRGLARLDDESRKRAGQPFAKVARA